MDPAQAKPQKRQILDSPEASKRIRTVNEHNVERNTVPAPQIGLGTAPEITSMDSQIIPKIQNVVAHVNLSCELDLKKINLHVRNSEYDAKHFAAVIIRIHVPRTTAFVYATGKLICIGAKNEADSHLALRKYARIIHKLGYPVKFLDFKIKNVVASCDVRFPKPMESIYLNHFNFSSYDPELYPGVIYRMVGSRVRFLIFVTGKIVIGGAKSCQEVYDAFDKILPILKMFKKQPTSEILPTENLV